MIDLKLFMWKIRGMLTLSFSSSLLLLGSLFYLSSPTLANTGDISKERSVPNDMASQTKIIQTMSSPNNAIPTRDPLASAGSDPLGSEGDHAAAIATTKYPDIYGGMVLTNHGNHINIYLTDLNSTAEKDIEDGNNPNDFTFIQTPHSTKFLEQLHQKIIGDVKNSSLKGINIVGWGPEPCLTPSGDIKYGKELIKVENLTPAQEEYLNQKYGASNIDILSVGPEAIPQATDLRLSEFPSVQH